VPIPETYDAVRYLHAKRSVDDRALNRGVLEQLRVELAALPEYPRVLELGAGVGTMVSRLADLGWLDGARYTLIERDAVSLAAAAAHLRQDNRDLKVDLVAADALTWLAAAPAGGDDGAPYDLVVANAFLDLVDVPALLPLLWRRVQAGRPFWFSINFDGETIFLPERPLDGAVTALYHRSMDQRVRDGRRAGDSRTGRRLLQQLPASGARLLGAGSSDWIVWPSPAGDYPGDEAYFLHHIVHTIDGELNGSPELDAAAFADWVAARHADVERGQLIYLAHQIDVVGRAPG
jgi:SAM-dependent methyltransferase